LRRSGQLSAAAAACQCRQAEEENAAEHDLGSVFLAVAEKQKSESAETREASPNREH
jgi:hypothetical protein